MRQTTSTCRYCDAVFPIGPRAKIPTTCPADDCQRKKKTDAARVYRASALGQARADRMRQEWRKTADKRCRDCGADIPFGPDVKDRQARRPDRCTPCAAAKKRDKERRRKLRRHGLTPEKFDALLAAQGGGCAVCGTDSPSISGHEWHIDHDHSCCPTRADSCGKCVRGLLCGYCNPGLGYFRDNPDILRKAIAYLERKE